MSKITFRADDDLVDSVERLDASKSEVMREALRAYLDDSGGGRSASDDSIDGLIADRVDALIADRFDAAPAAGDGRDVNVNVTVEPHDRVRDAPDSAPGDVSAARPGGERPTERARGQDAQSTSRGQSCGQCGHDLSDGHVYCPNCGEKAANRVFCDCGDEIRTDWSYCPGCGRRTPSAGVLDG